MVKFEKKVSPEEIFVTRLKSKLVKQADGSYIRKAVDRTVPKTPYPEMDQLAQRLAKVNHVSYDYVLQLFGGDLDLMRFVFPRMTGMHVTEFLREYKLMILREMMIYTNLSVAEAAKRLSRTKEQLSCDFKKKYSWSPVKYRIRYRNEQYAFLYEYDLSEEGK